VQKNWRAFKHNRKCKRIVRACVSLIKYTQKRRDTAAKLIKKKLEDLSTKQEMEEYHSLLCRHH